MRSIFSLLAFVTLCHGYLDFTIIKVDNRLVNEAGDVNPFTFLAGSINALQTIRPSASNAQAWATFNDFCVKTYGKNKANQIHDLASTTVDSLLSLPEAFQSVMSGSLIDTWNKAINGYSNSFKPCNATVAGITALQLAQMNMKQVIYPGFTNLFYNPFDTAMLSSLNDSSIMRINMNLFTGNSYSA